MLLVGGAGVPNYGDELIVQNWVRWYHDRGVNELTVSGSSARVLSIVAAPHASVRTSEFARLARFATPPPDERDFYSCLEAGYRHLSDPSNDATPLSREFLNAEIVHLHGGGYLNSKWPTHAFLLGLVWGAKERTRALAVGTGLGWGPLEAPEGPGRVMLRDALEALDLVEVRDDWSHDFLDDVAPGANLINGLDDAFLQPVDTVRKGGSALHVSLHSGESADQVISRLHSGFVGAFDAHYFWMCTSGDAVAYASLAKKFPSFLPLSWASLLDGIPLHESNFMVTARFHPHLVGARVGMTGIYRSGSGYYDVKHGSLLKLGSPYSAGVVGDLVEADAISVASHSAIHRNDADLANRKRETAERILAPATTPATANLGGLSNRRASRWFSRRSRAGT